MLPSLTPDTRAAVSIPPPPRFRPIKGAVLEAHWEPSGASGAVGLTDAQKAGLRYEARVQDWLSNSLKGCYVVAPYLHFRDDSGPRTAIPDGVMFGLHHATIFEIKSQHTHSAWWQLRRLYEPVVKALSEVRTVMLVEVVRSFDPAAGFPEPIKLCYALEDALDSESNRIKVLVWKP